MLILYKIGTSILGALVFPFVLFITVFSARWRQGFWQRMGFVEKTSGNDRLLIHAASVGEVHAAGPLIDKITERIGRERIVVSTMTPTGNDEAKKRFADHRVVFFPADVGNLPGYWLRRLGIARVILFETELWPNFLSDCQTLNIPVAMINARISDRSFPRYRFFRFFLRPLWGGLSFIATQNKTYRKRLIELGAKEDACRVTGNVKFESSGDGLNVNKDVVKMVRAFAGSKRLLIFASTHEGEESAACQSLKSLFAQFEDVAALIAPRHKERFNAAWKIVEQNFPDAVRRSLWRDKKSGSPRVMLLDTLGELASCFPISCAAFVGGSLVDVGGHNLLEPAAFGLPVITGPYTQNFQSETLSLSEAGGLIIVKNGKELTEAIRRLLDDENERKKIGDSARSTVEKGAGAMSKTLDLLADRGFL